MKRLSLASLSLLLPLAMNAQIVRGDMDGNGKLTIADVTLLANTVIGCTQPIAISAEEVLDNSMLVGIWYKAKNETVSFFADGTTNFAGATNYKFLPGLNYLILTDARGRAKSVVNVTTLNANELCIDGETIYTRTVPAVNVTSIVLNVATLQLFPSASQQLEASILPAEAGNQKLIWKTSDPKVATVVDGLVTAVAVGTATITCTATDGSGVTTSCIVTVTPEGLPGTQVDEGSGA